MIKKCKICNKTGKVRNISNHKKFKGYVCDYCNNYFSIKKWNALDVIQPESNKVKLCLKYILNVKSVVIETKD